VLNIPPAHQAGIKQRQGIKLWQKHGFIAIPGEALRAGRFQPGGIDKIFDSVLRFYEKAPSPSPMINQSYPGASG